MVLTVIKIYTLLQIIKNTVQSLFSDITFSDNLWFSDLFPIYYIKAFDLVTLISELVTVFRRPKVSPNRDCTVQKVKMGYQKGEVVLRDQPFAYVIKLDCRSKVCDYCVKSPKTGKPLKNCSACKIVYYCNANCQKSAWNSHHQGKVS